MEATEAMEPINPTPCGGCAGVDSETPARIDNPPGQGAIAYRTGTHAQFLESMLARLSSAELPSLAGLKRRDGADASIALCDGLATVLDVLSFYGERVANEIPLRTATELRSLRELARLIGYEPAPGLAASTWLAFTLQEAPADPSLSAGPVPIPVGTRVQSVPGPGEEAQTFETVELIEARSEWNAVPVQTQRSWQPEAGDKGLWLEGLGLRLAAGDVILIVDRERREKPGSSRWAVRLLTEVREDRERQRTQLLWNSGLDGLTQSGEPASEGWAVHVFRQRAALFGHNAPNPRLLRLDANETQAKITQPSGSSSKSAAQKDLVDFVEIKSDELNKLLAESSYMSELAVSQGKWRDFKIKGDQIDLDAAYGAIVPGSWLVLVSNGTASHPSGLAGEVALFRAQRVAFPSRSGYALSARITRIQPDHPAGLAPFRDLLAETLVLAQSEAAPVAARPLGTPLFGKELVLERRLEDIGPGHVVALLGKAARVRLRPGVTDASLSSDAGGKLPLRDGDSLRLIGPPEQLVGGTPQALDPLQFAALLAGSAAVELRLRLLDRDGSRGWLQLKASDIELEAAHKDDPLLREIAVLASPLQTDPPDRDHSRFRLAEALRHVYDRDSLRVNLNVAAASHGETVNEVLGSGDARLANVRLPLRQGPLTYLSSAASASGRRSTLELRVNDLLWQEVPSLYGRGGNERVYALEWDASAGTRAMTGDGQEGGRLASGDHNLRARYRKGLGLAGNVRAGSLTTLLSRPLGVSEVVNPEPAEGGEDPEPIERLRQQAPLTVRTLDRAVSLRDYRDFAQAFPGIAKAHALWIAHGPCRGVFLTVAGEQGKAVSSHQAVYGNLLKALRRYGDPLVPLHLRSFDPLAGRFRLRLRLKVAADAETEAVKAAVAAALGGSFGFEARRFGQAVWLDEVAAVVQAVAGVEALLITALHRSDRPVSRENPLRPTPILDAAGGPPRAAELLLLEPGALVLETLP
jgi:hypothetical protein